MRTGFDSINGEPLLVNWNRIIKDSLYESIPKLRSFSQSYLGFWLVVISYGENQISANSDL